MARSPEGHERRIRRLKARVISNAPDHMPCCTIPDPTTGIPCGRPTARAAKAGLSAFVCRRHQQHTQRHGSPWCKTPAAAALRPYLSASLSYVASHRADPFIEAALHGLSGIMSGAGLIEIATRLRGLAPDRRAKIALARLREAEVTPARLLAVAVAVHALIENGPASVHRVSDYRIVAIAKAAHRLASGYHRIFAVPDKHGRVMQRTEMHVYPRSSGRVLRHLGEAIERECELVIQKHLASVIALKAARFGTVS